MKNSIVFLLIIVNINFYMSQTYHFPEESGKHEGTWLKWPHQYQHGVTYRNRVEQT